MKKKLLALFLSMTVLLTMFPPMAGAAHTAEELRESGDTAMEKLTKAEIAELLEENSLDLPSEIFVEEPSVTAPYAQGEVSQKALQAAVDRLNALRRIAGLPAVELDEDLCELSQYGAAVEAIHGELTHYPTQPEDMDDDFFQKGYESTTHSNINANSTLTGAVDSFMNDSDAGNIEIVGHRRWQLNPLMGKIGFGFAESTGSRYRRFTTEYSWDQSGEGCDFDFIGWPASGYFPNNLTGFGKDSAWSVSLDPDKYAAPRGITVTLRRESDGQEWTLSGSYTAASSGKYLNVVDADYYNFGNTHCIIFRPDGITKYEGVYTVEIDGLKTVSGSAADFAYQVDFFDPENFSDEPVTPDQTEDPDESGEPEQSEEPEDPNPSEGTGEPEAPEPEQPANEFPVNTTGLHSFGAGLAIKADGTLVSWGTRYKNYDGTDNGFSMGHPWNGGETVLDRRYTSISVCDNIQSAAGITEDGVAEAWGALYEYASFSECYHPDPVEHLTDVKQAFRSIITSIYLKEDGTVWLSKRAQSTPGAPVQIFTELSDVVQVANNWAVCYALCEDGSLWSYGKGYHYESGVENDVDFSTGTEIDKAHKIMDDVAYVTAGMYNAFAVKKDGSLWGWGDCSGYALGNGGEYDKILIGAVSNTPCVSSPTKIMDGIAIVATNGHYSGAVTPDGKLYTWGSNAHGQLGFAGGDAVYESGSQTIPAQSRPKYVMDDVVDITCGNDVIIVQKKDGSLWAAGSNDDNLTSPEANGKFVKIMENVKMMVGSPTDSTTPSQPTTPGSTGSTSRPSGGGSATKPNSSSNTSKKSDDDEREPDEAPKTTGSSGTGSVSGDANSFRDVVSSAYYYTAVQWAVGRGVTAGTSPTEFSPDAPCSRSQVVTFLWRAMGSPEPTLQTNPFTDISAGDYYYKAVLWAYENGITSGITATVFGSEGVCTRGQVAAFLWRAEGKPKVSGGNSFADVSGTDYFAEAVDWAVSQGITSGTGRGVFSPDTACTRAEIVTFLYRDLA